MKYKYLKIYHNLLVKTYSRKIKKLPSTNFHVFLSVKYHQQGIYIFGIPLLNNSFGMFIVMTSNGN